MGAPQADGLSQAEPCSMVSALTGFDPSRWRPGDVLSAGGDVWRVGKTPAGLPGFVLVNRLFGPQDDPRNVPAGHCYPATDPFWEAFVPMIPASAIEARSGETVKQGSTEGESATAESRGRP